MAEVLLALEDIEVRYGDLSVLRVPALAVYPGEVLAIIGPNGAGKSTLLRVMGLLEQPARGKVYFRGTLADQNNSLSVRRRMASVFQEPLLVNAPVYENAALGLKLRGLDRRAIERRVRPWLERLGIAHLARHPVRSLSGGEAQRTSLVRALALDPELLLLDEPFSALDPPTREALLLELDRILRETDITTVFVTHDRNEAFMLGDRVAVLAGGEILQVGRAADVFAHPISDEAAQLVGADTRIPAVVESVANGVGRITFSGGGLQLPGEFQAGESLLLCLRPEDISLSLPQRRDLMPDSQIRLEGKIVKITPWASYYQVVMECGGNRLAALVSRPVFLELKLREGDGAVASFKTAAVHVIRRR